jgi:RNA polymerase sigma factor (sigma-70 family)
MELCPLSRHDGMEPIASQPLENCFPCLRDCLIAIETTDWPARLRDGSDTRSAALDELRGVLERGLTRALRGRYGGVVGVDDIVQISLVRILDALDSFRGESRFTTWALSIAVRVAMSELRRRYYRDVSLEAGDGSIRFDPVDPATPSPETNETRTRLCEALQRQIEAVLTNKQRAAIRGALAELPVEVIAERLGSNRNAVYKLLHDARARLKEGLEASGFTVEDIRGAIG